MPILPIQSKIRARIRSKGARIRPDGESGMDDSVQHVEVRPQHGPEEDGDVQQAPEPPPRVEELAGALREDLDEQKARREADDRSGDQGLQAKPPGAEIIGPAHQPPQHERNEEQGDPGHPTLPPARGRRARTPAPPAGRSPPAAGSPPAPRPPAAGPCPRTAR